MNAQSLGNKTDEVSDYICDMHLDVMAVTESWLTDLDTVKTGD